MKKDKINILILVLILVFVILTSYFLYETGITNKLSASINKTEASLNKEANVSDYPVIKMVINSSGEKLVNDDVAITVLGESNYKIDKVYYSFDKKIWYDDVYFYEEGKNINAKIVFNKTIDKVLYIKLENEKGYQSYVSETNIKIDKQKPVLKVNNLFGKLSIIATDNFNLSYIQYSYDSINWEIEEITGKKVMLKKDDFNYKYIRLVDSAGNISKVKTIKK